MKLHLMSDLHLDVDRDWGKKFLADLDPEGADVCVLAGDITTGRFPNQFQYVFKALREKYPAVVFVPGNHEYYRSTPAQVHHSIELAVKTVDNVHFLEDPHPGVKVGGVDFHGGTMWFRDSHDSLWESCYPDFSWIEDFKPWVFEQQALFEAYLEHYLYPGDVVVTHMLPAEPSIASLFKSSPLNIFYLCEMEHLIEKRKPALWMHGHTHVACDYRLGDTRVVCNPRGYPRERSKKYKPKLIEVSPPAELDPLL